MYDFDAYEAVDELIDEINDDYAVEAAEEAYQQIYEELCERVECDELTLEEAELINDAAAEKYLYEKKCGKDNGCDKKKPKCNKKKIAACESVEKYLSEKKCDNDDECDKKKPKCNKKKIAAGVAASVLAAGVANKAVKEYKGAANKSLSEYKRSSEKIRTAKGTKKLAETWGTKSNVTDDAIKDLIRERKNIKDGANHCGKKLIKKALEQ